MDSLEPCVAAASTGLPVTRPSSPVRLGKVAHGRLPDQPQAISHCQLYRAQIRTTGVLLADTSAKILDNQQELL
jgi:hypothetical protein